MYDAIYDKLVASAPETVESKARVDLAALEAKVSELQIVKTKLEALGEVTQNKEL